jgi:hypothetical protein
MFRSVKWLTNADNPFGGPWLTMLYVGALDLWAGANTSKKSTAPSGAVGIKPVSGDSLRKTGIFADKTGDFPRLHGRHLPRIKPPTCRPTS